MIEKNNFETTELNILVVGATGVGKSSTINALFKSSKKLNKEISKVGNSAQPQTNRIEQYSIGKINIWDTPGLGDTKNIDDLYKKNLEKILTEVKKDNSLIDLVMVIIDSNSKNIETSLHLINNILLPILGDDADKRIIIMLNKIDTLKNTKYWDFDQNKPNIHLETYLVGLVDMLKSRIFESTGVSVSPIPYSAGNQSIKVKPYNLMHLMHTILLNLPDEKRAIVLETASIDKNNWENNHETSSDRKKVKKILREILRTGLATGISTFFGGFILVDL